MYTHIRRYKGNYHLKNNIEQIINDLENVIKENSLEVYIQSNSNLIDCFISGSYRYNSRTDIKVEIVIKFYNFFMSLPYDRQKNVLDNLHNRLNTIKVEIDDGLPF